MQLTVAVPEVDVQVNVQVRANVDEAMARVELARLDNVDALLRRGGGPDHGRDGSEGRDREGDERRELHGVGGVDAKSVGGKEGREKPEYREERERDGEREGLVRAAPVIYTGRPANFVRGSEAWKPASDEMSVC